MSIPDAPWIGMCREDYYGYKEETACCEGCCVEFDRDELKRVDGEYYCKECYERYFCEEEDEEYEEDEDASSV